MSSIAILLSPLWLSWKNDFLRGGQPWRRRWLLIRFGDGLWCGIYYLIRRVLLYFQSVYDLGPSLAYQLLLIILLTFLSMLLFSNLITALSTFFLARDLDLVRSTPVPARPLLLLAPDHYDFKFLLDGAFLACRSLQPTARSLAAEFYSIFGWRSSCPFFDHSRIRGRVGHTSAGILPLPAKRIRDILFFIGLFSFIIIYFLFRFSQPERLVQPESFGHFLQFLTAMETPASPFLPSSWSAEVLAAPLFKRPTRSGFLLCPTGELRAIFPAGYLLGLQRRLLDRLVQSPGIEARTPQNTLSSNAY